MVTLKTIMSSAGFKDITLAAGEAGLNRQMTGVNVAEVIGLTEFFRPHELLVTTGMNTANDVGKLIEMVKTALQHKAAGMVLNIGPYIPAIPEQVLRFADEHQFPIFQMPWRCRIADFLKTTIQFLASSQTVESKNREVLSRLLFQQHYDENFITGELLQAGFKKKADYGIIVCSTNGSKQPVTAFSDAINNEFSRRYKHYLSMIDEDQIIFLVDRTEVKTPDIPFSKTADAIHTKTANLQAESKLYIGMGNFYKNIKDISNSYDEAKTVIRLAERNKNPFMYKYKDIGAYKILMAVREEDLMKKFHQDMLGLLYRYDRLNDTDYIHFLRIFLEEDGSTACISRREFIHRNTVLYKMKKIESLLDADLNNSFTKTNLTLAFMIEDLLK
ncbi:PucR family transcriptional regulator [Bacillus benzoevorans]|uniref:Sugar diacid utilization regulator n=1 Tax=Bacillus benzoevorans TaxID=1456 RepID=A0A7X0LW35_9BACI|nr:PucR family transcriptional regulator [Bacillus benzoevorans]MBB6446185.1 sugar diacid utilization regulator [Bacillus benzoevorans]